MTPPTSSSSPSAPGPSPLISAAALASRISRPGVLVVDCRFDLSDTSRGHAEYLAGHIPGAVYAHLDEHLSSPRSSITGRHPLPTPAAFAATLGSWGLAPETLVIACDQANGAYASRLWWMLRSVGHGNAQVLDGGIAAWRAAGHAVETTVPAIQPTSVTARPFNGVVDSRWVQDALEQGSIALVDARGADRFAGQNETLDPVAGHVPGSLNHPFARNMGADGRFLDAATLRERWLPTLAATRGKPLVAMCGSGVTACHNLLALDLIEHPDARLYAGSFSEWITSPARPVATGAA